MYDWPRDRSKLYQVVLTISIWSWWVPAHLCCGQSSLCFVQAVLYIVIYVSAAAIPLLSESHVIQVSMRLLSNHSKRILELSAAWILGLVLLRNGSDPRSSSYVATLTVKYHIRLCKRSACLVSKCILLTLVANSACSLMVPHKKTWARRKSMYCRSAIFGLNFAPSYDQLLAFSLL
jgi:hypothetical protein